jgi:predicted metal-dependent enzyme (double-stranded beta helix superfamily)
MYREPSQIARLSIELPERGHATDPVAALANEIVAACAGPPDAKAPRVMAALKSAAANRDLLTLDQRQPRAQCYARHVIHSDPAGQFTILAIVWAPGQFSPPHAHHTWCAYAVQEHALEESLYAFNAATSTAQLLRTEVRNPGYCCFASAGLDQIHKLGNPGRTPAISIHVYGVDRQRIDTQVNRLMTVASETRTGSWPRQ